MTWYDMQFLSWDDDNEVTKKIELPIPNKGCMHIWREYVGLNEVYDYCILCEKKRDK